MKRLLYFLPILIGTGIAVAKLTSIPGGGGGAGGTVTSITAGAGISVSNPNGPVVTVTNTGTPGGAATASLNYSTGGTVNVYRAISSETLVIPAGNPVVATMYTSSAAIDFTNVTGNTSTQTLSGLSTYTSQVVFSSSAKFNPPVANAPAVIIDGVSNVGMQRIGSTAGSAGGFTRYHTGTGLPGSAYFDVGYDGTANPNQGFYIATPSTRTFMMLPDGKIMIGMRDNNGIPSAMLHVTTAAGSQGVMIQASTGATTIFQVAGNGVLVSSLQATGIILGAHMAATNSPSDGQIWKYDAATGKGTWGADATGGSSGLPLVEGATNYINSSTTPTGGVLNISSGTVQSTFTVKGGLILNGPMTMSGTGVPTVTGNGLLGIDANNDGTIDHTFGSSSATFPTIKATVDAMIPTTNTIVLTGGLREVKFSTQIVNLATANFTNAPLGVVLWDAQYSTNSQEMMVYVPLSTGSRTVDPWLNYAAAYSTGTDPDPIQFQIAVASANSAYPSIANLNWQSTFTVTCSTPGYYAPKHEFTSGSYLTNWKNVMGPAMGQGVWVRFINFSKSIASQRWVDSAVIFWRGGQ